MILPLADTLMNCLQNLTSRIAGMDNEMMANRVLGMGTMLGFSIGAIKEQFNSPSSNIKNGNSNNNSNGGLKGLVTRAKTIINPSMNLSPEKDYNGNINPIRTVLPKEKITNKISIPTSNNTVNNNSNSQINNENSKSVIAKVAKTGFNATKTYLNIGASMAEGNFDKLKHSDNKKNVKNNFQYTEYVKEDIKPTDNMKSGDKDEFN